MMAVKQYSYWMQLRPPGPGAQPMDGMIQCNNREIWYNGSHYWGEVIYNRELTREEVSHYDMELHKVRTYD
jgi:hypothetical protein